MKILIVTMDCGECHNMIAESLYKNLSVTDEVKIVNLYQYSRRDDYGKWYLWCIKNLPHTYTAFWNKLRKIDPDHRYRGVSMSGVRRALKGMEEEVNTFQPDAVFCTHNYAASVFCYLKIQNRFRGKIYAILCDFCVCPFWEAGVLCDGVFTPHEMTHPEMISRGFREEQLHAFGFPINEKYEHPVPRGEARTRLGIKDDEFFVVSLNGGKGVGENINLLKSIFKANTGSYKLRVAVVCGRNEREYRRVRAFLKKHPDKNAEAMGFVQNVDELMSACDVLFNRGGCGTLSESLACGVPTVAVREYSVAQETFNAVVLGTQGRCVKMKKVSDARMIVEEGIKKERRDNAAVGFMPTGSIRKIADYIHAHGGRE